MPSNNPYFQLLLDRSMMLPVVTTLGAQDVKYEKTGNNMRLSFEWKGKPFKMAVYEVGNGKTTLSCLNGEDKAVFSIVADALKEQCAISSGGQRKLFSVAISNVPREHTEMLFGFLETVSTTVSEETGVNYKLTRHRGKQGDALTIKQFDNGTLQFQGTHGLVASEVHDFLTNVLPYDHAVQLQIDTFNVPIKVEEIKSELAAVIPNAHGKLESTVRGQFASALTLTKVNLPLEDYGAIAFPALKGMEGFLKSSLTNLGFVVPKRDSFHEYFHQGKTEKKFVMRPDAAEKAGEPCATNLSDCYTLYYNQRHGVFHMEVDPAMSRILKADDARGIVRQVFDAVDRYHR